MNVPNFIQKIDWEELKKQKNVLIGLSNCKYDNSPALAAPVVQSLEGIIALIDALQDYAVDEAQIATETQVFDLSEDELDEPRVKTVFICTHCNSDDVQHKAWVAPNRGDKFVDMVNSDELGWCNICQQHAVLETVQLKADAKVIGYQVVGEDGTDVEGGIHHDMDASFCVYSLSQCREMIGTDTRSWRIMTIWDGDIEEPTMMFEGNPNE
jgi:transcription elongation factor Elf1